MSTLCNLSHCAWHDGSSFRIHPVDTRAWTLRVPELRVSVAPAASKGLGVFAAQSAGPGRFVCHYEGEVLNLTQLLDRYGNASEPPEYVFRWSASWSIDARDSTHFSKRINHDQSPNLQVSLARHERRIDIFAKRPIRVGEELTIDYGLSYWRARSTAPAGFGACATISCKHLALRQFMAPTIVGLSVTALKISGSDRGDDCLSIRTGNGRRRIPWVTRAA
ncbi:MAG: hypothetical protein SGPRY_013002 [Prymnesium sp.]